MSEVDETELELELARLRALVGPCEQDYAALRQDLLAARDVAKGAEASAGALRGQVAQLHVELARARQDQDHFQRMVSNRAQSMFGRVSRSMRTRFF
jgi:predicted  nucleic acid-binding Zn-ribbon protein